MFLGSRGRSGVEGRNYHQYLVSVFTSCRWGWGAEVSTHGEREAPKVQQLERTAVEAGTVGRDTDSHRSHTASQGY